MEPGNIREQLQQAWEGWDRALWAGTDVPSLQVQLCRWHDALLQSLCAAHVPAGAAVACIAVGGYGRRDLAPGSDLDLLFLVGSDTVHDGVRAVQYALWDAGIEATAVVRTVAECAAMLRRGDLRTQTTLLDARLVAGDPRIWQAWGRAARRVTCAHRWRRRFVAGKLEEQTTRRSRFGGTPFFLEPNVKDAEGGLRDWHTLWWIGLATGSLRVTDAAVPYGAPGAWSQWLSAEEADEVFRAVAFLTRVRWALHRLAGRKQDRLGLEEQRQIAVRFHQPLPDEGLDAEEVLIRHYYRSAAIIRDASNWLCWRWTHSTWRRRLRLACTRQAWCIDHGRVAIHPDRVRTVPDVVRLFSGIGNTPLDPVSRHDLRRLARHLAHLPATTDRRPEVGDRRPETGWNPFAAASTVAQVLRELQRTHLLEVFFPEFAPIRHRAQRDAYHCFTVDTHLIQAVAECVTLLTTAEPPPGVLPARALVTDQAALLLATLYHDVGKGRGGAHAQVGAEMVAHCGQRLGLADPSIRLAQFLVKSHQIMPKLAFTRDLHDDALIEHFAATVETTGRLAALYLLSIADLKAVGPQVYTQWKGELLYQLYRRTWQYLERGGHTDAALDEWRARLVAGALTQLTDDPAAALVSRWIDAMPERYVRQMQPDAVTAHVRMWYAFGEEQVALYRTAGADQVVTIDCLARDRRGLLAKLCGVLALWGINILDAQVFTGTHGYVIDRFRCTVPDTLARDAAWREVTALLADVVKGYRDVEALLRARPRGVLSGTARVSVQPGVVVDNGVSEDYTVIDLRAGDRIGLLHDVAQVFFAAGCTILSAKVMTIGHMVHDAFAIQDPEGHKVTAREFLDTLRTNLKQVLQEEPCALAGSS